MSLLASFAPFETLKGLGDAISKDGNLELFTPALYASSLPWLRWGGLGMFFAGAVLVGAGRRGQAAISLGLGRAGSFWDSFWQDARVLSSGLSTGLQARPALLLVAVFTGLAAVSAGLFLNQPMRYDESYTVVVFASRPLRYALSDYHLPNNHVFHTFLVHLAYSWLGSAPWMVRLPAFLAGMLSVPAVYLAASRLYNRPTAVLSAGLLASSGVLADYATNARGYTLIALFALLALALGAEVRARKNRFAWLLLIIVSALGFYTIPIMLYPFGLVFAWLFLSALIGDVDPRYGRWGFIGYLIFAGLLTGLLAALLYTPVFLTSGVNSLVGNGFVTAEEWGSFSETIFLRFRNTWRNWAQLMPLPLLLVTGFGLLVGLVFHRKTAAYRVPVPLAAFLWIGAVLLIQRVTPWPRIWFFLLPMFLLFGSAGLVYLLEIARRRRRDTSWPSLAPLAGGLALLLVVGLLVVGQVRRNLESPFLKPGIKGEAEDAVLFLRERLQPQDQAVSVIPLNYPARFYFMQYGLERGQLCSSGKCPQDAERYYILVNERDGQSLDSVLSRTRLDERLDIVQGELIHEYVATKIYLFDTR